jgi:deoxyribonuclease IV
VLLGAHVSTSGGIHTAIDRIESFGGDSVQIFTQSPRTWRQTNHDPANFERFKERRAEAGIGGVLCHALYLVNLASPKDDLYEKSVSTLEATMDIACSIEADGVVFHVGSHLGAGFEAGLDRAVPALRRALEHSSDTTWLLVENSAVPSRSSASSSTGLTPILESASASTRATCGCPGSTSRIRRSSTRRSTSSTKGSASTA